MPYKLPKSEDLTKAIETLTEVESVLKAGQPDDSAVAALQAKLDTVADAILPPQEGTGDQSPKAPADLAKSLQAILKNLEDLSLQAQSSDYILADQVDAIASDLKALADTVSGPATFEPPPPVVTEPPKEEPKVEPPKEEPKVEAAPKEEPKVEPPKEASAETSTPQPTKPSLTKADLDEFKKEFLSGLTETVKELVATTIQKQMPQPQAPQLPGTQPIYQAPPPAQRVHEEDPMEAFDLTRSKDLETLEVNCFLK